ncbi:SusC/RagA family TonB-linked outer membrane protein [Fodinibius salsisoli]|uniref:TonB-dependent receptor n=1 Tax=Fodinibius salsisoli TaxID=2820877 RepID=A0ABT3PQ43_9BACT|nr:TonB-dependent receptor [Fodinibius salsisoli]MCW9707978.1 TonB-dependent receptor [Fodinibius salsisoli]
MNSNRNYHNRMYMKGLVHSFRLWASGAVLLLLVLGGANTAAAQTEQAIRDSLNRQTQKLDSLRAQGYDLISTQQWDQTIALPWDEVQEKYSTASTASVSGDKLGRLPQTNLTNALTGQLPGLIVQQTTSEPGFNTARLWVRGLSTFGNSSSRVFVDGYERSFHQLDPNEIESITILKDAAANAQYGIMGANRTILVRTKRGASGGTKIRFSTEAGIQEPLSMPDFLGSHDYAVLYNEALRNDGLPERFDSQAIEAYRTGSDPLLYPDVDWQNKLLKNRTTQSRHNFNISGGNDVARYFVSLGLTDQQGLFKHADLNDGFSTASDYSRYNFRSNVDIDLDEATSVTLDLAARLEERNTPGDFGVRGNQNAQFFNPIFNNISTYPPGLFPMRLEGEDGETLIGGNAQYTQNPYGLITNTGYVDNKSNFFLGTVEVNRELDGLLEGLSAMVGYSFDYFHRQSIYQRAGFAVYQPNGDGTVSSFGSEDPLSGRGQNESQDNRSAFRAGLNYQKGFDNASSFEAGLQYYQSKLAPAYIPDPFAQQLLSFNSRYVHNGKYIGQLAVSYSGSENFAPGERFGFFPVASAAWIMSKEDFLSENETIDFLKLRASFGLLGNENTGGRRYPYTALYDNASGSTFGDQQGVGGIAEGALPNPDATWETAKQANIGIDLTAFNERLNVSLDGFFERREDILSSISSVPDLIGATLPAQNVGIVENKGVEWDVTWSQTHEDFNWFVRALGSFARNEIVYQDEPFRENPWEYRRGHSVGQPFGLVAEGFFQDEAEIANSPVQTFGDVQPGDIKYRDLDDNGIINDRDVRPIGNSGLPELYYGAQLGFEYKGFSLSALLQGTGSHDFFMLNGATRGFVNARPTEFVMNRWTPETAGSADYPRLTTGSSPNNYRASTFWLRDAQYLRLRHAEIGYRLPVEFTSKFGVDNLRIYVNGYNLLTFTDLDSVDPENQRAGISQYPLMRVFNLGINIGL